MARRDKFRAVGGMLLVIAMLGALASGAGAVPRDDPQPDPGGDPPPQQDPPPDPPPDCASCRRASGAVDGEHVIALVETFEPGSSGTTVPTTSSYLADCNWQFVEEGETEFLHPLAGAWEVTFDEPHWLVWCAPFTLVYTYFPAADGPDQSVIDDMIRDAYYRTPVTLFNPQTSPDGSEDIPLVVRVKTWMWVDETLWDSVSASASLPPITVTTTAEPYLATWTGGDDPAQTICLGPGIPYQTGIGGEEAQDDSCTTTYLRDSTLEPDREIAVSVRWSVSYTCTAFCTGGDLPDIITNSSRPVVVTEIQSVGR